MGVMAKTKVKKAKAKTAKRQPKKASKPRAAVAKKAKPVAKKASKPRAAVAKKAKPVAKKASKPRAAVAKAKPPAPSIRRRDGTGHLDPKYAADLLRQSERPEPEGVGFIPRSRSTDDLAEALGEQFIEGATSGEGAGEEQLDQEVPEERGGPFVRSNAGTEFAEGVDRSNPKGAKREPFPTT